MKKLRNRIVGKIRTEIRERICNPLWGGRRFRKIHKVPFTIISNNCWGGHVYRYFAQPYDSPTVGLFFYSDEYIRFLSNIKKYIGEELKFIPIESSRYYDDLQKKNLLHCPIGLLADVEIVFMHYKTQEEAKEKWTRRASRIHWNNLIIKMTQQNLCTEHHMKVFDKLPYKKKIIFTSDDYKLESQIIFTECMGKGEVVNDTLNFRRYVDLIKLINGQPDYKKNQPQ